MQIGVLDASLYDKICLLFAVNREFLNLHQ
jgi:hypothetical protein